MAIDNFKKIEDTKGYLVDDKDRNIFEREISKGYFGINVGDTIEFVLYDSNDNSLPQESADGKLVRYIEYNDNTEKDYFGKSIINKKNISINNSDEFFVDIEKLIQEAGYSNGVFKSQVSLINRRLGSAERVNDSAWIHEISPSRTEIRILPTIDTNGLPNSDLAERYECLVQGETFFADAFSMMDEFIEQFNIQSSLKNMLTLKGEIREGENYIKLIETEFRIDSFDLFLEQVRERFVTTVNHYKNNRDYDITSNTYGQVMTNVVQPICISTDVIMDTVTTIIGDCIEFSLPNRDVQEESSLTINQQETLDDVDDILSTLTSNDTYTSTIPDSISAKVHGCKDVNALNYNENADVHDVSLCVYPDEEEDPIKCMDSTALNFGEVGKCKYKIDELVRCDNKLALNFGKVGECIFEGDFDDNDDPIKICKDPTAINYNEFGVCRYAYPISNDEIIRPVNNGGSQVDVLIQDNRFDNGNNDSSQDTYNQINLREDR